MSKIIALNKKHQSTVNKAVNWLIKHNEFDRQRDIIANDLCGWEEYESKEWRAMNRKCQNSFDKYEEYTSELPAREVKQIEKSELY